MPGGSLEHDGVLFTTSDDVPADVVVVVNYLKYDTRVSAKRGYVWNWHNEPIVRQPFARGYDRVFTHVTSSRDPRVRNAPPILNWWVNKTYDELEEMAVPQKTKSMSAIASTKTDIKGHRVRHDFIGSLEAEFPSIDVFGHGRSKELSDKWEGLAPYRYSLAIENTTAPHYWTEKIVDCFLAFTVPVYFGATNIGDYFPDGSYIWLPLNRPTEARKTLENILRYDSWEHRLPTVLEARRRVLENYSLYGQLFSLVRNEETQIRHAPRRTSRVNGRRTRKGGWIRGLGVIGNVRAWVRRRNTRLQSRTSDLAS
jgi:hypothetical protein